MRSVITCAVVSAFGFMPKDADACELFGLLDIFRPRQQCVAPVLECLECETVCVEQKCRTVCTTEWKEVEKTVYKTDGPPTPPPPPVGLRWTLIETSKGLILIDQLNNDIYKRDGKKWVIDTELALP